MSDQQVFRYSFWSLWWRFSLIGGAVILLGTLLAQSANPAALFNPDQISYLLIIITIKLFLSALFVLAHVRYFTVTVDADGISAHAYTKAMRNRRVKLRWSEINAAKFGRHLVGLPCCRLYSNQRAEVMVVLRCLTRWPEFASQLKAHGINFDNNEPVAPLRATPGPRPTFTPIREGGYIVITTERRPER